MMRKPFAVAAVVLIAVLGGLGMGVWLMDSSSGPAVKSSTVGGPFRLMAHDGRTVADTDFRGRPFLIFFGFTHCPDICPTTLFEVSELLEQLGPDAEKTHALFVTVDPERDTPEVLASYIGAFHPRLLGLTGDAAAIQSIIRAYRVYARKIPLEKGGYTMDHTAVVYLMDKDGRFVAPFSLKRPPEAAAADFRRHL